MKDKPAFPVVLFEGQELGDGLANGMTFREHVAVEAMKALFIRGGHTDTNQVAIVAVDAANELIAELQKEQES